MPVELIERARRYVAKMPGGVSGQDRHSATFHAAFVLVHGFGLSERDAWPILQEFNQRCDPPSDDHKLAHRLKRAVAAENDKGSGFLVLGKPGEGLGRSGKGQMAQAMEFRPSQHYREKFDLPESRKPAFDETALRLFAGELAGKIDLLWLAARSSVDPCTLSPAGFLEQLYGAGEKVLVFTEQMSQGQALWPDDELPREGTEGVWFLAQPVDGRYYPNPRSRNKVTGEPQMSRRSEESVTAFRYFVIESDKANVNLWLAALVQLPLRIAAIYSSGGRSVHALVQVDAPTKGVWDAEKTAMKQALVTLGADPGAMSAVRLTRLPGCCRGLKSRGARAKLQKLLYVQPNPPQRPLVELMRRREVLKPWLAWAEQGVSDADETGGEGLTRALEYYAPVSAEAASALKKVRAELAEDHPK